MSTPFRQSILVLGAGIQGICAALALGREGYAVTLIDQAEDCMTRASLRNEGKIHLGLVYAKDDTMNTAALMLRAALRFGPLIEKFLGRPVAWERLRANPFDYLVMNDSMLSVDKILQSYARLQSLYEDERSNPEHHYVGLRPRTLFRTGSVPDYGGRVSSERVVAAIKTTEIPLRVPVFRELLRQHLHSSANIEILYRHRVESIDRTTSGFRVEGTGADGETWKRDSESVVNCLWDGRLKLDEQMGVLPERRWVYRLKYRLFAELPESLRNLPSLTMVLGPFGDIVTDSRGPTYLSWYPASMKGWNSEVSPPAEWKRAHQEQPWGEERQTFAREILEGFETTVPGIVRSRPINLAAGVIFSWGESDIDDPESKLHQRDEIGIESHDGYFSINTGKFTCAPLFAEELVQNYFRAVSTP